MSGAYFTTTLTPDPLLWADHDPWLVALSVVIAMGASAVALYMAGMARDAATGHTRRIALGSGALALASGVWTMHYIGMLAFAICGQAGFDPWLTLLSIVPCLGASWVALKLLMRRGVGPGRLWGSGLLVGAGIGAMHYIGMAASQLAGFMRYDIFGFALSVAVAVVLAVLALWVRFGLAQRFRLRDLPLTAVAGAVMGAAIAGMHYTGMAALRFVQPAAGIEVPVATVPVQTTLSLAIAVVTIALAWVIIAVNGWLRSRQMVAQIQAIEGRQRAILDTAVDGIVIVDDAGIVQSFNPGAARIFGWDAAEIVGRPFHLLAPEEDRAMHDANLRGFFASNPQHSCQAEHDILALRRDGSTFPARLAFGRVQAPGAPLCVGFIADMSAREATERALRASEAQLRAVIGNLPGVTFRCATEEPWEMLFISDGVLALTGWQARDFRQGVVQFGHLIHEQDRARINAEVQGALQDGEPYQVEYRITTRGGQTRWVAEFARGAHDETDTLRWIDGVMLDVTQQREVQAEYAGIVAAIDRAQAEAEFSLDGHLLHANANYLALMGYERDEVLGLPHAAFCMPEYAGSAAYAAFWHSLQAGQAISGEVERLGQGGRRVWLHATCSPIFDAEGKVAKILEFATDLSARRAMEQDLRAAKERAEQAAAARTAFLANMSHEIRTPMNAIIGFTDALLDTPLQPAQRLSLATVQASARSLLHLLNDILDTAKLERGAVRLEVKPFDLRVLCEQALSTLQGQAAGKHLTLTLDYPATVGAHWHGDEFRLRQILLNLLGNAVKFTHEGGVRLRVSGDAPGVRLDVVDTGIGMDEATVARIFDRFAQADASTTRRYGGTGLGTSIARQLTELMGGRIDVASEPGRGSTFSVRLPLRPARADEVTALQSAAPADEALPPLTVLGVDDVPANLEVLALVLQRAGHRMVAARGGEEALALWARQRFDVVLMDLQMPGIDGMQTTRRLRAAQVQAGCPRVPVIALSASVLEPDRQAAAEAGMDGFVGKPLEPARLFAELRRVLGPGAPASPALPADEAPQALAVVDWERGGPRWGGRDALVAALQRFVQSHSDLPERLIPLASEPPALAVQAHRLRGAVGNLALMRLQAVLGALETAARAGDVAGMNEALAGVAPAWAQVLQAVPELDSIESRMMSGFSPLEGVEPAPYLEWIAAADVALARGELPDEVLHALDAVLPALDARALREALERFDFEAARAQLARMRRHLQESMA